jgi:uncharacterized delta-60 repeat protein
MTAIQLDTTFGQGGWVGPITTGVQSLASNLAGLVRTRSGILVAAGTGQRSDGEHFYLTAYEPDGELAAHFGDGGAVVSELFANGWALAVQGPAGGPVAEARERAEMLLVGGQTNDPESGNNVFVLQRYSLSGRLDRRFGVDGTARLVVASGFGYGEEFLSAIAVQTDRSILGVGSVNTPTGPRAALVRWHADGQLDTGFGGYGGAGRGRTVYPPLDAAPDPNGMVAGAAFESIALQADGKIVVGGQHGGQILLARFTPGGGFDHDFGENGRANLPAAIRPLSGVSVPRVLVQRDGRIVLLVTVLSPTGRGGDRSDETAIARVRLLSGGGLDPTFGKLVLSPPPRPGPHPLPPGLPPDQSPPTHRIGWDIQNVPDIGTEGVYDADILPGTSDSIIAAGGTEAGGLRGSFLITRYVAGGDVDTLSTGPRGAVETAVPGGGGYATACIVDPHQSTLTVAGAISASGTQGVGLARYLLTG